MGFFKHLRKAFKKVGHDITHPKASIRKIDRGIKKAERSVIKVAAKVEKVGAKAIHQARNVTHIVAKNAKIIDQIIDVAATAADGVAVAVGQPELVAGIETLRNVSKRAVDAAEKADKVINTAEKFVHVAGAIKNKEKVSVIMRQTADAFTSAGELSGNPQLQHVAKQLTKGADITEKVVEHSKALHDIGKQAHKAIKDKDVGAVIKTAEKVVKQTQKIKKDVQSMKQHKAPPHPGTSGVSTKPKKTKPVKEKKTKAPKEKKTKAPKEKKPKTEGKKKRKPSAYNLFVAEKRKQGMSMKEIGAAWRAQKGK